MAEGIGQYEIVPDENTSFDLCEIILEERVNST